MSAGEPYLLMRGVVSIKTALSELKDQITTVDGMKSISGVMLAVIFPGQGARSGMARDLLSQFGNIVTGLIILGQMWLHCVMVRTSENEQHRIHDNSPWFVGYSRKISKLIFYWDIVWGFPAFLPVWLIFA